MSEVFFRQIGRIAHGDSRFLSQIAEARAALRRGEATRLEDISEGDLGADPLLSKPVTGSTLGISHRTTALSCTG